MKRMGTIFYVIIPFMAAFILAATPVLGNARNAAQESLPLAAGIRVNKAQRLFEAGEVARAAALLEDFRLEKSRSGRDHYYIHFLLGNYSLTLAQEQNDRRLIQKAVSHYQDAVNKNPSFTAGWLNLAKSLYESDTFEQSGAAFEKGYQTSEIKKPIHLYYASVCYFHAGAQENALRVFKQLLKAHPDKVSLAWKETYINILFSLERFREALPYLETLAETSAADKKKKWQEILLYQYLSLNMNQQALAYAGFLTRTNPLEPKWWKALSHIHLNANQFKQGVSALMIYGYLTPMTKEELKLAADLYLSLDIPKKAAFFYQAALKDFSDPEQIFKISQACVLAHEQDKALSWIEKGLSKAMNTELLQLKARILYNQKAYAAAADAYEKLANQMGLKKPAAPHLATGDAWLMLGYAAMNDHQLSRAEKAFLQASGYKKQKKSAQKALAFIKTMPAN